mgnify:CR=1 FL=1|jgi:hypothetical protein
MARCIARCTRQVHLVVHPRGAWHSFPVQVAKQTEELEAEHKQTGRGGGLKHAAEVLEVRLTDQLLMLDAMLGDCETSAGRVLVKAVVAQVRALGTRLLRFSQ